MASRKDTTICIENLSSVTPVVIFTEKREQLGEGPLTYRARACATGPLGSGKDVRGRLWLPAPNVQMDFWGDNGNWWGPVTVSLNQLQGGTSVDDQEVKVRCLDQANGLDVWGGDIWDDGLLRYVVQRQPDGVGVVVKITIQDSPQPLEGGKPFVCSRGYE